MSQGEPVSLPTANQPDSSAVILPSSLSKAQRQAIAEYQRKRRAADIDAVRLRIKVADLVHFAEGVALGARKIGPKTAIRLSAAFQLLNKVMPDVRAIEFKGLVGFAPISARAEALAKLTDDELATAIALADKLAPAIAEEAGAATIDGTTGQVLDEDE